MMRAAAAVGCLLLPGAVWAQEAAIGANYQGYTFGQPADVGLGSVRLVTLPFAARSPLAPWASVLVSGAYADMSAEFVGGERDGTTGWTDVRGALELRGGPVLVTMAALVPTGDVIGDRADATLTGLLASDLLPFAATQWGTGGAYSVDAAYLLRGTGVAVEVAGGTSYSAGSSDVLDGSLLYRPGLQVRGRVGVDASVGDASVLSLVVGYQHFMADRYDDVDLFTAGARIGGALSYAFPLGPRASAVGFASVYRAGEGAATLVEMPQDPVGLVGAVGHRDSRVLARAGGEVRFARGSREWTPHAEVRVLRRADGTGQGWVTSLGSRGRLPVRSPFGGRLHVEPAAAIRFGRVVAGADLESRIVGWEVGVAGRWSRR